MTAGRGDGLKAACITVLGSGHAPFASGTWGSATAILLAAPLWFTAAALALPRWNIELAFVAGILLSCILSIVWGVWAVTHYGRKDPKQFVLDEFAGQWVALLVLPIAASAPLWTLTCVWGGQFFLFRIFDIIKPPPAAQLERLPAGWGILLDDLFAGLYANLVGQALWRFTPAAAWLNVQIVGNGS
jgi:phosphatidylglycerophosphatase A